MAGADGNEGLLKGEAPFREKGCWGGCLGSIAPGAEGGPENNGVACSAPEMTRVLGAGWAPSQVDLDDAAQRLIAATGVGSSKTPKEEKGSYCKVVRRPELGGQGRTSTSEARRDAESASPTKNRCREGVCGGRESPILDAGSHDKFCALFLSGRGLRAAGCGLRSGSGSGSGEGKEERGWIAR